MHHLGGFNRCFSSGKVCRFCMADYSRLNQIATEKDCVLRTNATQEVHLAAVEEDSRLSAVYGVEGSSPLLPLPHFRVPLCLPPDIMHSVNEKFLCLSTRFVLRGLNKVGSNKRRILKYSRVLQIHSSFKFSKLDMDNRPPALRPLLMRKRTILRGSASQKWHLFHFLSLILGPYVPKDNPYWRLHLLANQICDIVFAVSVIRAMEPISGSGFGSKVSTLP